jgi:hypothetical protein
MEKGLSKKEMNRRAFLKATGVFLGAGLGFSIMSGMEYILEQGGISNLLEKKLKEKEKESFKNLKKYQIGEKEYVAKPYDSYSKIVSQDIEKYSFLNNFDGSDLRGFYKDLNDNKEMQKGSKYILPVWKKD